MSMQNNNQKKTMVYSAERFILPNVRIHYAQNLFKKSNYLGEGPLKYSCSVFWPTSQPEALNAYTGARDRFLQLPAMQEVLTVRGSAKDQALQAQGFNSDYITYADAVQQAVRPETDPERIKNNPYLAGCYTANPKTVDEFPILAPDCQVLSKEGAFFIKSGDYVNVQVSLKYSIGSKLFALTLLAVQFVRAGEPVGPKAGADLAAFQPLAGAGIAQAVQPALAPSVAFQPVPPQQFQQPIPPQQFQQPVQQQFQQPVQQQFQQPMPPTPQTPLF